MAMKKWMLWVVTILLLLVAVVFLMWAVQTAWLGSFPGKDKSRYSMWAALQLGGAVVSVIAPIVLWVRHWRKDETRR
jgi:hypothetical protein